MLLNFKLQPGRYEKITNYELFLRPNGIYRAREIEADNYLYPMYYLRDGAEYLVSTSVYALIHAKQRFLRNPRFQSTYFFRPSFLTIDAEVMRARTTFRRSTLELRDPREIVELGARLIQEYVSEIEARYPGWVHILSMGGKDSENIILARRRERWIVLSGEPNAPLNKTFLDENGIDIHRFVPQTNDTDNSLLREEIIASDCMYDPAHFRWVRAIRDLVLEHGNKAVLWLGTAGDAILSPTKYHRYRDYYDVHHLYVGMAMGI